MLVYENILSSEDECVETPQKSRRELIVKQRAASEVNKTQEDTWGYGYNKFRRPADMAPCCR